MYEIINIAIDQSAIKKRFFLLVVIVFFSATYLFGFGQVAQAATRTWDGGGGDANWNTAANWSIDTAPTASDIATFDGTCASNCSPTVNVAISVAGISMAAGYTGTITQSATNTITVGSSHWVQASGTFTGGSGDITVNGTFTLSGGTFTAPTGTMTIGRFVSSSETFFTVSGGTFTHNSGTMKFVPSGDTYTKTVDVVTSLTLYNVEWNAALGGNVNLTTAASDTIIVANDFTQTNGMLGGIWEVQGNIIIGSGADGGAGTLTYTAAGAHTYTYTAGGIGPHLQVNNASATVSANTGTTALTASLFSLLAGTFTAPTGTMTIGRFVSSSETFFTVSGGTFTHNDGTVKFVPSGDTYTKTVDVVTSLTLYNVEWNAALGGSVNLATASGDTVIVSNNFTHTNGILVGTWEVQGNVIIATTADGGSATLTFTGTNAQTYTDQGGNEPDGDITINKTSGTVTLASNSDWNAASQDLIITAGTLSSATYNITTVNFTVNGGTFTGGSGTVTTSGPLIVSSGTFTGGAGNITINSTFTLSGGTFTAPTGTMTIDYSGGNATIFTVSGGTFNHSNGTVNFSPGEMNYTYTVDVATSLTLYNVIVSVTHNGAGYLTTAAGDTIIIANDFTQTDGRLNGTWQVQGNVILASTSDGGDATLTMTGTGDKTYTYSSGGFGPHLRVNNAALSVTANTGTTGLHITSFSLLAGTFTAPTGTMTIDYSGGNATIFTVSGGTFNHSNGTVNFSPGEMNYTYTVDVATSLTLYNVIVSVTHNGAGYLTTAAGDTIIAANNFTHTDGLLNGTWQVQGNVILASTADGGTATIAFTGGNDQTYTDQGGNEPDGDITINKTSGTVTLASNADWNAASQDLIITAGTLNTGGFTITGPGTGALSVANGATLIMSGASPYPASYGSRTYGATSTVRYAQSVATTTVATTYGHLEVMPGADNITHTFPAGTTTVNGNLTLGNGTNTGAIVTAATNAAILDVNGTTNIATNTTFVANSANPLTIAGSFTNSGTFTAGTGTTTFDGASAQTVGGSLTGASAFGNVVMSGVGEKSFSSAASTTNFSILSGASVVAPSALTVIGNLSNAGTFTANGGLVTLTGTNQTISTVATTTFYSLTKLATTTDTLTFTAGKEYEFAGTLTLAGATDNLLLLRSSASGTYWYIDPQATTSLAYVDAKDSDNVNITTISCSTGCIDGTGNINWSFTELAPVTVTSAAASHFYVGQATTTLGTVTINQDLTTPSIASTTDLRIVISTTTTNFRFDTNTTALTFGGTASGKVSGTVAYENDGAVLVIDVISNFTANDTLMISDIVVGSFMSVSATSGYLTLQIDGNSTGTPAATDTAAIYITGRLTLSDHTLGQVNNEFSFQNKIDTAFFAFNLETLGENATVTDLVITLAGVQGIDADNFTNFRLYRDNNNNLELDGGDTLLDATGILTINGQTGAITFSSDFIATTSADYLMIANTDNVKAGESVILRLASIGVTAIGDLSLSSPYIINTIESIQHHRGGTGAGGSSARIGDAAPAGAGLVTGGGNGGGVGADTVPDGENITPDGDFFKPTTTGTPDNEWTNGPNAYDSDGVYATAASTNLKQSYANFGFGIPAGNTIQGLAVKLDISGTTADGTVDVSISWDGGSSYTTAKATPTVSGTDVVYTVGGNADTWGRTWSTSEFSTENFRLRVSAQPTANTIRLDALEIRVFHQAGGGGAGGGAGGGRI